jgi:hypothetical protein
VQELWYRNDLLLYFQVSKVASLFVPDESLLSPLAPEKMLAESLFAPEEKWCSEDEPEEPQRRSTSQKVSGKQTLVDPDPQEQDNVEE